MKRVLIFDLDNTIYAVKSIGDKLFAPLFNLLEQESYLSSTDLGRLKEEVMKRPFQKVADKYQLSQIVIQKATKLLKNLTCEGLTMKPFDDYHHIKRLFRGDKFLVTTGFVKMQQSKIKALGIENDFKEIFIVDPETTLKTKRDFFEEILKKYHYHERDVLVIGDDPESEIGAARELGLDTFLFDPDNNDLEAKATYKSRELKDLEQVL